TGIATISLFSAASEPLAERLIFIQNYDQLNLEVSSDKTSYPKRGKTTLTLKAINRRGEPAAGHFSVSVIDESKVPDDENSENTILSDLLLTSDLKGTIEEPNYYFNNINNKTIADLDLVTLTHGYRRFEWKKLLNNEYQPIAFQPEKGLQIAGLVKSLSGSPIVNGKVSLISMRNGIFSTTTTDNLGHFHFSNLVFSDSTKFMLQAVTAKGKNNTSLSYEVDTPLNIASAVKSNDNRVNQLMQAHVKNDKEQVAFDRYGGIKRETLKEVVVRDRKTKHYSPNGNLISPELADQLITSEDLEKIGGSSLKEKILEKFYGRARGAGLIVVDGVSMPDRFNIDNLNASDVETVAAVYGANAAIYGMRAVGGVWLITTKQGKELDPKDIASFGVLPIIPKGFYKAREFYSPKYENMQSSRQPDLRSTIYWKPELQTGKDGAAAFEYFNADGAGKYRVTIEGVDDQGNIGRRVYRYDVE
ncbi:MAG: TonB-dependent receptor plug domain-containing protein, partial [Sphingobacteriales bacterium]